MRRCYTGITRVYRTVINYIKVKNEQKQVRSHSRGEKIGWLAAAKERPP